MPDDDTLIAVKIRKRHIRRISLMMLTEWERVKMERGQSPPSPGTLLNRYFEEAIDKDSIIKELRAKVEFLEVELRRKEAKESERTTSISAILSGNFDDDDDD